MTYKVDQSVKSCCNKVGKQEFKKIYEQSWDKKKVINENITFK